MKKKNRWLGIALGSMVGLIVIVLIFFFFKGNTMLKSKYSFSVEAVPIPTEATSIQNGAKFVKAICSDCHTPDLSGKNMVTAPFGRIDSANLTAGIGGAAVKFTDTDWVRAIRHGIDDEGRALVVMPAQEFWNFSDQDLGDIIAFVKTYPPIDKEHQDPQINILGKIMFGAGLFGPDIVPARVIAHTQRPPVIPAGMTAQYGEYLVNVSGCHDCHGISLAGGKSAKPGSIDAPNLTPGGDLKTWDSAQFIQTVHTGITPTGRVLNPDEMPWKFVGTYPNEDLQAIFIYLQSLPPLQTIKP